MRPLTPKIIADAKVRAEDLASKRLRGIIV
jgi:hypothetical protein